MRDPRVKLIASGATTLALVIIAADPHGSRASQEQTYTVSELRGLGGADGRANSINEWGTLAGFVSREGTVERRAMVWIQGQPHDLGTFGGPNSNVAWPGHSNTGLVVGIAQTAKPQTRLDGWSCRGFFFPNDDATKYTCLGFAWEGGKIHRLRSLGGDNSFAASANNLRQVAGWAETREVDSTCVNEGDRGFRAVVWDLNENDIIELPRYGTDSASAATTINDRGQVAGISGDCDQAVGRETARHAVLWENGTATLLASNAVTWNTPTSITQRGDIIVGFANTPGGDPVNPTLRAVLWTARTDLCPKVPGTNMCDLGTLDGDTSAQAFGVNDRGQVVGSSCAAVCRAFLWENGVMKDLNTLKGDYPHRLENAMDINNFGQISGRARTTAGQGIAMVATPVR
jgi:probable HAF family extracellular repeat protein